MGVGLEDTFGNASVLHELQKRKQVEHDAGRLRNRLLQLERQTEKADKRITQTKQRARDVLSQRERNEKRERDRQRYIDELHQEIQQHREDITKCALSALAMSQLKWREHLHFCVHVLMIIVLIIMLSQQTRTRQATLSLNAAGGSAYT